MRFLKYLIIFLFLSACFAGSVDWISLHNRADQLLDQNLVDDPFSNLDQISAMYLSGLVALNNYQVDQAAELFRNILKLDPNNIAAKWGKAECLRREHDYEKAIPILEEVIKADPEFSPAYISLAYIKYIQKDFDGSIRLTGKVINQGKRGQADDKNYLRAHGLYAAAKGMIAHYGGPVSKAINGAGVLKHLSIIKEMSPNDPVVNFGLGSYYMLIPVAFGQDLEKAKEYLEKAIEADPLFPDPYVRLAQIYLKNGDQEKYDQYINKALLLDSKNEIAIDVKTRNCYFICLTQ
ncbi:MAG: tetratricopeptide repeat protein [Candidatus Omnitrophica bacterium]|nr:tetratricopeptide repeat protein [Candidatus Omnitrophota bacterium]